MAPKVSTPSFAPNYKQKPTTFGTKASNPRKPSSIGPPLSLLFKRIGKRLTSFLEKVIDEHMDGIKKKEGDDKGSVESEDGKDFVDVLLEIQKDNTSDFSLERDSMKALVLGEGNQESGKC
ncbi:hypothetical protein REPUB_Repub08aG0046100 [Reevesia pubescens]